MITYNDNPFRIDYGQMPDYLRPVYKALLTNPFKDKQTSPAQFRKVADKAMFQMQLGGLI